MRADDGRNSESKSVAEIANGFVPGGRMRTAEYEKYKRALCLHYSHVMRSADDLLVVLIITGQGRNDSILAGEQSEKGLESG